jgi:hypothetical protein
MNPNEETPNGAMQNGNVHSLQLIKIGEALKPLQNMCRDRKDAAALRMFAELLIDLSPEDIATAVRRYLSEEDELWFPSPARLRKLAMEATAGELPEWQHAWHRIMEAHRMWDRYDQKKAIAAREHVGEGLMPFVKNLGGFIALTSVDPDTLSVLQSNFRQSFTNERERATRNRALPESLRPAPAHLNGESDEPKRIA